MRVLAIDQGTSATKAVVFGEDGEILTSVEAPVTPHAVPGGGVEQDPEQLWESVCQAGREAVARAGDGVAAVGFANQGETVLAWDRTHGPSPEHGHLLAGPTSRVDLCRHGRRGRRPDAHHRAPSRSVFRGPEDDLAAAQRDHGRRGDDQRRLAAASPHGLLRHRRHDGLADAAPGPRHTHLVGRGLRRLRPGRVGPPAGGRVCRGDRPHGCLRPSLPVCGLSVDQQAALVGEHCLRAGRVEVHLRHGGLPPGQCRAAARRVLRWPGRLGGLAARRHGRLLHRRPGLRRRRRHRLAAALGLPAAGRGARCRRQLGRRRRRRHASCRP